MDFLAIGEPLAEFTSAAADPSTFSRRLGGDTLNATIYFARLRPEAHTGYLTRLGDDWMSAWMRDEIAAEWIDTSLVGTEAGGRPGLSFIRVDAAGERSFVYWRDQAPARRLFADDDAPELAALRGVRILLFSGITLAVLPSEGRARLLDALSACAEDGATVAYDTNYRPILWSGAEEAREWTARALQAASLALPSLDDAEAIFGCTGAGAAQDRLLEAGASETVLTTGGAAVRYRPAGGSFREVDLPAPVVAIDTTAAGDSFNAGFLAATAAGEEPESAIAAGARLAAVVVKHRGAIIPRDRMHEGLSSSAS